MKPIPILFAAFYLALVCSCSQPQEKPNIILISADDLGWSDLGCYGSSVHTPHLDKLAREGMRFTNFHNTSKCFPSRACLLTGVYAQQSNTHKKPGTPISNAVTLGEVLRTSGYRTMWSGKHHGPENPIYRGFDRYYGLKDGACNFFNPGNKRPGEGAPARKGKPGNKNQRAWCIDSVMYRPYTPEAKDFYTTDYFTNYALSWLDEYRKEEKPFFLYLAYTAPHDPLMAWPEDIAKYKGQFDEGYMAVRQQRYKKQLEMGLIDNSFRLSEPTFDAWDALSDSVRTEEIKKMEVYAAMIDRMDQNIGRVLNKLEAIGKKENTIVLFVSDNGASAEVVRLPDDYGEIGTLTRWSSLGSNWANVSNTPFRYFKNYSYEGGINTPCIAWWPGKIKANSFSRYPGHFIDIMATFVAISNASYPTEFNGQNITPMQGENLLPALMDGENERSKPLFWEWKNGRAAYSDGFKIVKNGLDKPYDLYNLTKDPTETNNLALEMPEKLKQMELLFTDWKKSLPQIENK